jgi:STAM-binding protein
MQNIEYSRPSSFNGYQEGSRHTEYRRQDDGRRSPFDDSGWLAQEAVRRDAERRREEQRRGDEARHSMRSIETQPPRLQIDTGNKKKEDALAIARRAANTQLYDSTYYTREGTPSDPVSPVSPGDKRREHDEFRKHDDRRRDEQDEVKRRRRREQEGILKRQEEAEFAAREARRSVVPSPMPAASAGSSQRSSFVDSHLYEDAAPLLMPIESPTRSASSNLESTHLLIWPYRNHAATPTSLKP